MASALITLEIFSTLLLLYPPLAGWRAARAPWGSPEMRAAVAHHILTAFPGLVLAVFAHAMTMFYFIGTGRTVKDARADHPGIVAEGDVAETVRYKRITSPLLTFAILMLIAAPISGGPLLFQIRGAGAGWLWIHLAAVGAMLPLQCYAAARSIGIVLQNIRLLQAIDARFAGSGAARPAAH